MVFTNTDMCWLCPAQMDNHLHALWLRWPSWAVLVQGPRCQRPTIPLCRTTRRFILIDHNQTPPNCYIIVFNHHKKYSTQLERLYLTDHVNLDQLTSTLRNKTWSPFLLGAHNKSVLRGRGRSGRSQPAASAAKAAREAEAAEGAGLSDSRHI